MEQAPKEELETVLCFCCDVGLPVCLSDMGYDAPDPALLRQAAEITCAPDSTVHYMPFTVTPTLPYDAVIRADAIGQAFRRDHLAE